MTGLALILAASAAALWVGPSPLTLYRVAVQPSVGSGAGHAHGRVYGPLHVLLAAVIVGVLLGFVDGLRVVLALIGAGVAVGVAGLAARGRNARKADAVQEKVVEVCEALVGELRCGLPLTSCLDRCVEVWPPFGHVAAAAHLGADVPAALRRLAMVPGASGLQDLASAWQVSQGSGSGLAAALGEVAASARAAHATALVVVAELASAQATARLVAALPVVTLAMAAGVGAGPWHFLLDTGAGLGCLAAGSVLTLAGLFWIDRIASRVRRR
jgi:tight adherence protein B